jgi:hypothetical protein
MSDGSLSFVKEQPMTNAVVNEDHPFRQILGDYLYGKLHWQCFWACKPRDLQWPLLLNRKVAP